jgi:hypothetical protein
MDGPQLVRLGNDPVERDQFLEVSVRTGAVYQPTRKPEGPRRERVSQETSHSVDLCHRGRPVLHPDDVEPEGAMTDQRGDIGRGRTEPAEVVVERPPAPRNVVAASQTTQVVAP